MTSKDGVSLDDGSTSERVSLLFEPAKPAKRMNHVDATDWRPKISVQTGKALKMDGVRLVGRTSGAVLKVIELEIGVCGEEELKATNSSELLYVSRKV